MKAIILAAGYGGRMMPLTKNTHKTLLEIDNKSIIEKIIDSLLLAQISKICIVLGYKKEKLKDYVITIFPNVEFEFIENNDYRTTNNIYSLSLALNHQEIEEDIILIESDLIYDPNLIKEIVQDPNKNVAAVSKYQLGMDGTVIKINNGKILEILPPHLQGLNFNFSDTYKTLNVYKFDKDFINGTFKKIITYYSQTIDDNCYYELILGLLIYMQQKVEIFAFLVDPSDWLEVDDPHDLSKAQYFFSEDKTAILNKSFGGYWNYNVIDFAFIRNMYFPNDSMLSDIKSNLPDLLHNYGSTQEILNRKLHYCLLYDERYLHILNGASQVYPILQSFFASKSVLVPYPTFGEYPKIFGSKNIYLDNNMDISINLKDQLPNVDAVVVVNPNNPTGHSFLTESIFKIATKYPSKYFIIDESFIDFSDQTSIIPLIEANNQSNILVIKSLSKTWGVPGMRLGYIYTQNTDLLSEIKAKTPIWNMNSISEYFLELYLKYPNFYKRSITLTINDRDNFIKSLSQIKLVEKIFKSQANFILVQLKLDSNHTLLLAKELLKKYKIHIKVISHKLTDEDKGFIRLAVRLPKENMYLCDKIRKITEQW